METPVLSLFLKKKKNGIGMWRQCMCDVYKDRIVVSQGVSEVVTTEIDLTSNVETRILNSNVLYQFSVKTNSDSYFFQAENVNAVNHLLGVIRSIKLSQKPLAIDDFTINRVLGKGHFGKVLLVEHKQTGDVYAIKAIKKQRIINEKKLHTIFIERNILKMSSHPFIVTMYFAFQNQKKFYIGLEYVMGGALFKFLQRGRKMKVSEVRFYVAEVALALDYLHSKGILYRDLKLENVLLCDDGHIKLTDFGLSKTLVNGGEFQQTSTFCGTNEYLPPEMIADKEYGFEIDWWALGVFTYEFLVSETPFYHKSLKRMYNKILTEQPKFPIYIPAVVRDFILMLLEKDPEKRGTFKEVKAHPFFQGIDWNDVYNKKLEPPYIPKPPVNKVGSGKEKNMKDRKDSDAPTMDNDSEFNGFTYVGGND